MSRSHILDQTEIFRPELLSRTANFDRHAEVCRQIADTLHQAIAPIRGSLTPTQVLELDKEICGTWDRSWQAIPLPAVEVVALEQVSSSAAA